MEDDKVDLIDERMEEIKAPSEINKKRKLKTPAQLQALEEFYEDHKYPTESLKSEIAEKLGLTEKQVSGWFCHRRLKDKRLSKEEVLANGRPDRSSGVMQEHGNEPGQDSCGSTKPGGYKHADLREVESQCLDGQELSPKNIGCYKRMKATRLDYDMDETSSESSLPLCPSNFPRRAIPQLRESSKFEVASPSNPKVVIDKQIRRPSGYLKILPKAEHPVIAAVKRQLGNTFRHDGPPLSIDFDLIPIDAFQEAPKVAKGPSNGTEPLPYNTYGHVANSRHQMPKGTYRPDDMNQEEQILAINNVSEDCYPHYQPRSKPYTHNNGKLYHGWELSSNFDRENAEEFFDRKRELSHEEKYSSKRLQGQPILSNHFSPRAETWTNGQTDVSLDKIHNVNPKTSNRSKIEKNQLSDRKHKLTETHDDLDRRLYTREAEIEKLCSVTSSNTYERHNLVTKISRPKYDLLDDYPRPYRVRDTADNDLEDNNLPFGYPHPLQDVTIKPPLPLKYGQEPAGDTPSSSSEDKTDETSSSDEE